MQVDFIEAPPALKPWCLGLSTLRAAGASPVRFSVPAHTLAITTVVLEGALWRLDRQGEATPMAPVFSYGSATRAQHYAGAAPLVCMSLLCVASVLPMLTGLAGKDFVNQLAPADILGVDPVHAESVRGAASEAQSRDRLWAALQSRLGTVVPDPIALAFLATLGQWNGHSRVPPGWHERRWQRACQAQLGVTPKFLQRLTRLHHSVRQGLQPSTQPMTWSDQALDAGYADQSHLIKDYRELGGLTPQRALAQPDAPGVRAVRLGAEVLFPRLLRVDGAVSDFS